MNTIRSPTTALDLIDKETDLAPIVDMLTGEPLEVPMAREEEYPPVIVPNQLMRRRVLMLTIPALIGIFVAVMIAHRSTTVDTDKGSTNTRRDILFSILLDSNVSQERLTDKHSPAYHALEWLTADVVEEKDYETIRSRFALATLYYSTSTTVQGWESDTYWLSDYPVCLWEGVTCQVHASDQRQQVQFLELGGFGLVGTLPSEVSLLELDLHVLDLSSNHLYGTIPNLEALSNLKRLYLGPNNFTSSIPDSIYSLKLLDHLYLDNCDLTGSLSSHIGQLKALKGLGLEGNFLTGSIPSEIGLLENLRALYLDSNEFGGVLPDAISQLTNIVDLRFSDNHFTGSMPNFEHLKFLEVLHGSDNEFTGPLPSIQGLARDVQLFNNKMEGPLPSEWATKSLLWHLYLDGNLLSGSLPSTWTSPYLESLLLFGNDFSGRIPEGMGDLVRLRDLGLQSNRFTKTLPASLGQLTALEKFDVSSNLLTGNVPSELVEANNLVRINLENNQITGDIPWQPKVGEDSCDLDIKADCDEVQCLCCLDCQ